MAVKQTLHRAPKGAMLLRLLVLSILLLLAVAACKSDKNEYVAPPPPQVTVSKPLQKPVTEYVELTGNLQAYESVDLVARVEGFLTSINFKDGDFVKKDKLLFVIEPQPYEAKLALQEATVEQQKATLQRAEQEYARQLRLIKDNATSQSEVEKWRAERDAAKAALDEALANTELAQINLGYTKVAAPFHGRMDRHLVDIGNLVGAGQATTLATILRQDPIYAYFNLSEHDLIRLMKKGREEHDSTYKQETVPVYLEIAGEENYPHKGQLDFASSAVNNTTGTLQLRAIFKNPVVGAYPILVPGMFARIRIPVGEDKNALLVPDSALGMNQGRHYLLVVNDRNVVEQRTVKIGTLIDDMRVIQEGLKNDEWVVVDGVQRARPDAQVTPVRKSSPTQEQSKPASAAPPAQTKPSVKP
jgi:RND family efflux transporter MFP subunit